MIHVKQCWEKFVEELQKNSNIKILRNDIMCKDKLSSLNFIYYHIDYHNNKWNHTYFWDLSFEKRKRGSIYLISIIKNIMN
jgi:hypothetical protein